MQHQAQLSPRVVVVTMYLVIEMPWTDTINPIKGI